MVVTKKVTAPAAPAASGVNKWDEELAKFAKQAESEEPVGGNFISTRGGRLQYGGSEIPGNKMNAVIISYVKENHYYEDRFDATNPASPVCFAFADEDGEMKPHSDSAKPQCSTCAQCPKNQFGSADQGKGKACKNIRRLGLITEDGLDDVNSAEVAVLKIPVTSVKAWSTYVQQVANAMKRPPFAVVTEISCTPDSKHQFHIVFKPVAQITDGDTLSAIMERRDSVFSELAKPYPKPVEPSEDAAPTQGANAKGRKY